MSNFDYDFKGWATRNNIKCSDGRVIMQDAFVHNDGQKVPLVWNHQHGDPNNVLGYALLENRKEGVYTYGKFNDTESGKQAKQLVVHRDVSSLSIYANQLKQQGSNVIHGSIREVSLVLAGANAGAYIESVIKHGETCEDEILMFAGEEIEIFHSEKNTDEKSKEEEPMADENKERTVKDVFDSLTEEQRNVVYALIGQALEENNDDQDEGEEEKMKHNLFDNEEEGGDVLSHSEIDAIFTEGKRYGSLRESVIAHGIENIDFLFPDATSLNKEPKFIQRDQTWVKKAMGGFHKTPFSRIKSMFANITEDDARAKGYIKGNLKKEEVFSLLKRTTTPTTIYKKQKMDRDDVVDINDFDVVAWLKGEMRGMLDEEIVRSAFVGDGRIASSDDKVNEQNIRPIWTDDDLYTIKAKVEVSSAATDNEKAKAFIKVAIKSRKEYKGSGSPTLWTTEDNLTNMLLMEDSTGRIIYDSVDKLATALRVKEIVSVPVFENLTRTDKDSNTRTLLGIIVNPDDYNIGADKGGAVNLFEDFDIDYNAQKYLIETRCSGALTVPYSAIALEELVVTPSAG